MWIDINKQAPKEGQKVITYHDETGIDIMEYHDLEGTEDEIMGKHFFSSRNGFLTDDVTHWMPLPQDPQPKDTADKEGELMFMFPRW